MIQVEVYSFFQYTQPPPQEGEDTSACEYDLLIAAIKKAVDNIKVFASSICPDMIGLGSGAIAKFAVCIYHIYDIISKHIPTKQLSDLERTLIRTSVVVSEYIVEITKSIATVVAFIQTLLLPHKIWHLIKEYNAALDSNNTNDLLKAQLSGLVLAGEIFQAPENILLFCVLCGAAATASVVTGLAILGAVSLLFCLFNVWINDISEKETTAFLTDLKKERHLAFLHAFCQPPNAIWSAPKLIARVADLQGVNFEALSPEEVKAHVSIIKQEIKEARESNLLNDDSPEIMHIKACQQYADQHFVITLNDLIAKDPSLVKKHFQINEDITNEVELYEFQENSSTLNSKIRGEEDYSETTFLTKLLTPEFQQDAKKLQAAVRFLKARAEDKITLEHSLKWLNSVSVVPTVMVIILACIVFPPLIPIAATVTGILLTYRIALIVEEMFRKNEFVVAMEGLNDLSNHTWSDLPPEEFEIPAECLQGSIFKTAENQKDLTDPDLLDSYISLRNRVSMTYDDYRKEEAKLGLLDFLSMKFSDLLTFSLPENLEKLESELDDSTLSDLQAFEQQSNFISFATSKPPRA